MKICDWKESKLNKEEVIDLMTLVGDKLPDPLSSRVNIAPYLEKLIINGSLYVLLDKNKKASGVLGFYANDKKNKTAFLSILGILPHLQGKGCGKKLIELMISNCIEVGMTTISLRVHLENKKAIYFYKKIGFYTITIKENNINMLKKLTV